MATSSNSGGSLFPTPDSAKKVMVSYSLRDLHKRIIGKYPSDSHAAESDCFALMAIVQKHSTSLLKWINDNAAPVNTVDFLYTPKPRKCLGPDVFPHHLD